MPLIVNCIISPRVKKIMKISYGLTKLRLIIIEKVLGGNFLTHPVYCKPIGTSFGEINLI